MSVPAGFSGSGYFSESKIMPGFGAVSVRIQYHLMKYLICLGNYDVLRRAQTIRSDLNPRPRTESQKGIEKRRVTSRYHGSKVSGSPQSSLTETE